jgi:hypothetical protein
MKYRRSIIGAVEHTKSYFISGVERVQKPTSGFQLYRVHSFILFMTSVRFGLASTKMQSKRSKFNRWLDRVCKNNFLF